eukprot:8441549-Heterocapsa_arctica.AAC.1
MEEQCGGRHEGQRVAEAMARADQRVLSVAVHKKPRRIGLLHGRAGRCDRTELGPQLALRRSE